MIICSPFKLISLLLKSGKIADESSWSLHKTDWFFSDKGKAAFAKLKTKGERFSFYHDYIVSLKEGDDATAMAFLLAYSVEDSSLPYASYPDIISSKNPLIAGYEKNSEFVGRRLLASLHDANPASYYPALLTFCEGEETSELYMLERDIIGVFMLDQEKNNRISLYEPVPVEIVLNGKD